MAEFKNLSGNSSPTYLARVRKESSCPTEDKCPVTFEYHDLEVNII
jgi:hypothetical protein